MSFAWGETVERRTTGIPFLLYRPRRTNVAELLEDAARWEQRTHLVQGDRRVTFGQMFDLVEAQAQALEQAGLGRGDRLLLLAHNSIEWVTAFWAGIRLGAVIAVGNSWWARREVEHALEVVAPTLTVTDAARAAVLPEGTNRIELEQLRTAPAVGTASRPAPADAPDEDEPAVIIFTAGTTGFPKAVTLAHRSILANLHSLLAVSGRLPHQVDTTRPAAVNLQSGPLFHIGGVQSLLLALLGGNTMVFLSGRFDPGEVLELIDRERVTVWGAIPTMASRVLEHPDLGSYDLSTVRSISMGGAPVQPRLLDRLREHFPNARRGLSTIYGMTETGGTVASASGALMAEHPSSAGRPQPVAELRIDRPDGSGTGEIIVRTPGQMLGYWGRDSSDTLDDNGFIHTGDLGRIEDGLLYVTGRSKDLIIRGGENIAPAHVEAALLTHPAVSSAAVIGRPDEDLGEHVAALVRVADGHHVTPEELSAHLAPLLARFEIPVEWRLGPDPLPMTDAGKTDKRTIVASWDQVL